MDAWVMFKKGDPKCSHQLIQEQYWVNFRRCTMCEYWEERVYIMIPKFPIVAFDSSRRKNDFS